MNKKIILTTTKDNIKDIAPADVLVTYIDDTPKYVELFYEDTPSIIDNIYVAHVNDLVKNINAAFVEYSPDKKAYLSLEGCNNVFFTHKKNTSKICEGDNIVVQIKKEPIKTKDAVCSTALEVPGKYIVLTYGKPGINVSKKINNETIRSSLSKLGIDFISNLKLDKDKYGMISEETFENILNSTGIIFRTDSATINDNKIIINELEELFSNILFIFNKALYSPGRTCLKEADNPIISTIQNSNADEVITDLKNYHEILTQKDIPARLYNDSLLPLYKLYSVESLLNEITAKKIWLKSGGYLVIDYTEAMTVIDVNTGKCEKGKSKADTILKINIEAATESLHQLRLRNISGIIIIDFIDMQSDEHKQALLHHLKNEAATDKIPTSIIGMTRLNLLEITRKKIRDRVIIRKNN